MAATEEETMAAAEEEIEAAENGEAAADDEELEAMKNRVKEMEDEAEQLRKIQTVMRIPAPRLGCRRICPRRRRRGRSGSGR